MISQHISYYNNIYFFHHLNFQKYISIIRYFIYWISKNNSKMRYLIYFHFEIYFVFQWYLNISYFIYPDDSVAAALMNIFFDFLKFEILIKSSNSRPCHFSHICAPISSFFWLFLFFNLLISSFLFSDLFHFFFFNYQYSRKFRFWLLLLFFSI